MPGKRHIVVILVVFSAALAAPAGAQAVTNDIGITQTASAAKVKPGGIVTFDVTVTNNGTAANDQVDLNFLGLSGHGKAAANPYTASSTSQGSCIDDSSESFGMVYHSITCNLGALAPGASAQVQVSAQVNQSMNQLTGL